LFPQNAILLLEVVDHVPLLAIQPASGCDDEDLPRS
jgi:hypothetical protein